MDQQAEINALRQEVTMLRKKVLHKARIQQLAVATIRELEEELRKYRKTIGALAVHLEGKEITIPHFKKRLDSCGVFKCLQEYDKKKDEFRVVFETQPSRPLQEPEKR